ncbi:ABC transporter substrate-binding protein [Neoroseomonas lacus]|uniref:Amino acid ABC transporter n=1 Tax=Neoroseomonas lacus TaxID=287609 RepID=A0A917KMX0_9PROT|nr:ABC transporter substrate-binding protein [Neoroseomonas lacus]GGJ18273.1 amino acid ABC transporter [Neoroseomonas lacus]
MSTSRIPLRRRHLLGATAGLLGAQRQASAQATPSLITPGKLTYGVAATFAPFEFMLDGRMAGYDIEFGEAVARKMGLEPNPVNMEFRGLIPALQGRRVDIINSAMYINPARSEQVDFVPYMLIGQQMVVRRGNPSNVAGRQDLCGRRVAVTLGGIQETYARQDADACKAAGKPELTVMTLPSAQEAALAVRNGRADAYYESTAGVARIVSELSDVYQAVGEVFEFGTRIGIAVRKGDNAMSEAIGAAIRQVVADGTYHRLMTKYNLPREGSMF